MIKFIQTVNGEFIAVETIALLVDVVQNPAPPVWDTSSMEAYLRGPVTFTIETKRGHLKHVKTSQRAFLDLIGSYDD